MSQTSNSQRVAVEVKDSTAKLIMGTLTDVGVSFDYQRVQGQTLTARVSVAGRNGPTLLKVRDVVQDRQNRAQLKPVEPAPVKVHAPELFFGWGKPAQTCDQSGMPPGFTAYYDIQIGYWYCSHKGVIGRTYKTLEACQKHALEKYRATQAAG